MCQIIIWDIIIIYNYLCQNSSGFKIIIWDQQLFGITLFEVTCVNINSQIKLILIKLYIDIGIGIGNFVANISVIGISVNFHIGAPLLANPGYGVVAGSLAHA